MYCPDLTTIEDAVLLRRRAVLGRRVLIACLAVTWAAQALAQASGPELELPGVIPVPPTQARPLSSAERAGTEYVDLAAGVTWRKSFICRESRPPSPPPASPCSAPPTSREFWYDGPEDPARFNGTVVIEPFTWIGERGAGWILTRDYLVRNGYAEVGYTLNINKPEVDPKVVSDPDWSSGRTRPPDDMNLDFMRRFDYARYSPLGMYYDPSRFRRGDLADPFVHKVRASAPSSPGC